jgi:hypothetical protein
MDALFNELRTLAENVSAQHNQLTAKVTIVMECSEILLVRPTVLPKILLVNFIAPDNMGHQ